MGVPGVWCHGCAMTDEYGQQAAEWLLRNSIPDMRRRIASTDDYERLGLAALLRRSLLDGQPVLNLARKRHRLPSPTFGYTPLPADEPKLSLPFYVRAGGAFAEPSTSGTIDNLLAARVAVFEGGPVSVKDFTRVFAHVEGAVHLRAPKEPLERYIRDLFAVSTMARPMMLDVLADIATVTVRGMEALVAQIDELDALPDQA